MFSEKCFFTDDTVMTIAVADALLDGGTADDFIDSMEKFGRLYPNAGYGGRFGSWVHSDEREPYNTWGNGSAMRVSPCGWFAESLEEAEVLAERSVSVTHNHPEGIKGAQATAAAIYLARIGKSQAEIRDYIESKYEYNLSRTLDEIRPGYRFNETCQETVPEAIIAFLESKGFEDAIRNAISLGGDSDTLAAITGSIAEAAYGITERFEGMGYVNPPGSTLSKAYHFIGDTIAAVINAWIDSDRPISYQAKKPDSAKSFSKVKMIKTDIRFSEKHYA